MNGDFLNRPELEVNVGEVHTPSVPQRTSPAMDALKIHLQKWYTPKDIVEIEAAVEEEDS